jgi:hypothetical protein
MNEVASSLSEATPMRTGHSDLDAAADASIGGKDRSDTGVKRESGEGSRGMTTGMG